MAKFVSVKKMQYEKNYALIAGQQERELRYLRERLEGSEKEQRDLRREKRESEKREEQMSLRLRQALQEQQTEVEGRLRLQRQISFMQNKQQQSNCKSDGDADDSCLHHFQLLESQCEIEELKVALKTAREEGESFQLHLSEVLRKNCQLERQVSLHKEKENWRKCCFILQTKLAEVEKVQKPAFSEEKFEVKSPEKESNHSTDESTMIVKPENESSEKVDIFENTEELWDKNSLKFEIEKFRWENESLKNDQKDLKSQLESLKMENQDCMEKIHKMKNLMIDESEFIGCKIDEDCYSANQSEIDQLETYQNNAGDVEKCEAATSAKSYFTDSNSYLDACAAKILDIMDKKKNEQLELFENHQKRVFGAIDDVFSEYPCNTFHAVK